jgi:signal transduction histidine kinase
MGLAICRSIIEAHEGRLWVTQKGSEGVIFQFTVPVDGGQGLSSSQAGAS